MSELSKIQAEVGEWALRNFPKATVHQPLIGVAEECGELCHAHLKAEQGIRGTLEEHLAAKKDAIGDMMIFLMHYCVLAGIDWIEVECAQSGPLLNTPSPLNCISCVGLLAQGEDIQVYRKHKVVNVALVVNAIDGYCRGEGIEFLAAVRATWQSVRQRDWQANKKDGSFMGQQHEGHSPV